MPQKMKTKSRIFKFVTYLQQTDPVILNTSVHENWRIKSLCRENTDKISRTVF